MNKALTFCLYSGGVLILLSLVLYMSPLRPAVPVLFFLGAVLFVFAQHATRPRAETPAVRRLCTIQLIGSVVLVLTAVPLSMTVWQWGYPLHGTWLVMLTVAAWIEVYTVFRLSAEERKAR